MGDNCLDDAIALANDAINDGLDEFEDYVNKDDTDVDVDALLDELHDKGFDLVDCVVKDINLHDIGKDMGEILARTLQRQIDTDMV